MEDKQNDNHEEKGSVPPPRRIKPESEQEPLAPGTVPPPGRIKPESEIAPPGPITPPGGGRKKG